MECKNVWPLASRWVDALNRFAHDPTISFTSESGMADCKDLVHNSAIDFPITTPTSSGTSPSSSIYGQHGNSLETRSTTLQPPPPHDISASLSGPRSIASHFPSPQIQQQAQIHQLQVHHLPHHHHHHHQLQQQPSPQVLSQHQAFVPPQLQSQLYMTPDDMTNMDMALGSFNPNVIHSYPIASQPQPLLAATITTATAVTHVPLDPPADGYETELNLYSYGPQEWTPASNIFDGYS
jgi:hypothetical protein